MSEIDYVIKGLNISQKSQFNLVELYKTLKYWFEINGYTFFEKEYEDIVKNKKKSVKIKWQGIKKIDDYSQLVLDIGININNYELLETEKEKLVKGELKLVFESFIETDYEEKWENKPIWKFLRGVSDKFFTEKKRNSYELEMKEDTYDAFNKTKSFLNLYKFR